MKRYWLLFSQAVTVVLAVYFVVATLKPSWVMQPGETPTVALFQVPSDRNAAPSPGSFRVRRRSPDA